MGMLFDQTRMPTVYCDVREHSCVHWAVKDLISDLSKRSGRAPDVVNGLPDASASGVLLIATLGSAGLSVYLAAEHIDASAIEQKEEHYMLIPYAKGLMILGSDRRGTMWGIYECCHRYLGVDPLCLWTDHEPQPVNAVVIPDKVIADGPKTYRFRGWFINDEDLMEGFCRRGPVEKGYRFHKDYVVMLDMIIETALRLKQNMLIPCSHLDILRPEEEALVKRITERGLYVSMHHQEPVGVHQFTMDRYGAEHGVTENVNFIDHVDLYREVWRQYIHRWARYEGVIWQLGLRGRGDWPVWHQNDRVPKTTQARGKLISDAIQMQYDMIHEECPDQEILSTATLWMEGMPLYKAGALTFPKGTMVIQSDFGPDQMWGEGYNETPRHEDTDYGVYYHLAFWGCGPHLIQGNRPEKIRHNFRQALIKGDTSYVVLNVSNFREFVYGIRYEAVLTWNMDQDDVNANCRDWCRETFEIEDTSQLEQVYAEYYQAFPSMDDTGFPARMTLNDGMARRVAMKMMQIIRGGELEQENIQNKRLFAFDSTNSFLQYYRRAAEKGLKKFHAVHEHALCVLPQVPEYRRAFYASNVIVQIELMIGLYGWVGALAQAAQTLRSGGSDAAFQAFIRQAVAALDKAIANRQKAVYGRWRHWYDGDRLMNLTDSRRMTAELLSAGGGKTSDES